MMTRADELNLAIMPFCEEASATPDIMASEAAARTRVFIEYSFLGSDANVGDVPFLAVSCCGAFSVAGEKCFVCFRSASGAEIWRDRPPQRLPGMAAKDVAWWRLEQQAGRATGKQQGIFGSGAGFDG
ncbi:hypothetical protein GCM10023067_19460 [Aminobacter aganoensis]